MEQRIDKAALIDTACKELLTYGVWDKKTRLKRGVKKYIFRRQVTPQDLIFWPTGLLAAGLWHCRENLLSECACIGKENKSGPESGAGGRETLVERIDAALDAYIIRWQKKGMPVSFLDDLLFGETLLSMYAWEKEKAKQSADGKTTEKTKQSAAGRTEELERGIKRLAEYIMHYPTDSAGSFLYRAKQNNGYVFADGIGLTCPFLYGYGLTFRKKECIDLALRQIDNFLKYGMDNATGLPYHGYDGSDGCKYGIIGWGRAAGWLLRGMSGCMKTEYGRGKIEKPFTGLLDAALKYQRSDGSFSWQLQALEGPKDTSSTAMICAAVREGAAAGVISGERYEKALNDGKKALAESIRNGRVYDCSGECEGFSRYPQRYGAYPWALGETLMLL